VAILLGHHFGLPVRAAGRRPLIGDVQLIESTAVEARDLAGPNVAGRTRIDRRNPDPHRDLGWQGQILIRDELRTAIDADRGALRQRGSGVALARDERLAGGLGLADGSIGPYGPDCGDLAVQRL